MSELKVATAPWCRCSIWDLLIVLVSCSGAIVIAQLSNVGIRTDREVGAQTSSMRTDQVPPSAIEILASMRVFRLTLRDLLLNFADGLIPSGIFILGSQWGLRKRREPLTGGEWLWLVQGIRWWFSLAVMTLWDPAWGQSFGFLFLIAAFDGAILPAAVWLFFSSLATPSSSLACAWTTRLGAFVSILSLSIKCVWCCYEPL